MSAAAVATMMDGDCGIFGTFVDATDAANGTVSTPAVDDDIEAETLAELAKIRLEIGDFSSSDDDGDDTYDLRTASPAISASRRMSDEYDNDDDIGDGDDENSNQAMFLSLSRRLSARDIELERFATDISELDSLVASMRVTSTSAAADNDESASSSSNTTKSSEQRGHEDATALGDDGESRGDDEEPGTERAHDRRDHEDGGDDEHSLKNEENLQCDEHDASETCANDIADENNETPGPRSHVTATTTIQHAALDVAVSDDTAVNMSERERFLEEHMRLEAEASRRAGERRAANRERARLERQECEQRVEIQRREAQEAQEAFVARIAELEKNAADLMALSSSASTTEVASRRPSDAHACTTVPQPEDGVDVDGVYAHATRMNAEKDKEEEEERRRREELQLQAAEVEREMEALAQRREEKKREHARIERARLCIGRACAEYMHSERRAAKIRGVVLIQARFRGICGRRRARVVKTRHDAIAQVAQSVLDVKSGLRELHHKHQSERMSLPASECSASVVEHENRVVESRDAAVALGCADGEVQEALREYARLKYEARDRLLHASLTDTRMEFELALACAHYLGLNAATDDEVQTACKHFEQRKQACAQKLEELTRECETLTNNTPKSEIVLDTLQAEATALGVACDIIARARAAHTQASTRRALEERNTLLAKLRARCEADVLDVHSAGETIAEVVSFGDDDMQREATRAQDEIDARVLQIADRVQGQLSLLDDIAAGIGLAEKNTRSGPVFPRATEPIKVTETVRHARLAGLDDEAEHLLSRLEDLREQLYAHVHAASSRGTYEDFSQLLNRASLIVDIHKERSTVSAQKTMNARRDAVRDKLDALIRALRAPDECDNATSVEHINEAVEMARSLGLDDDAERALEFVRERKEHCCAQLAALVKTAMGKTHLNHAKDAFEDVRVEAHALGLDAHLVLAEKALSFAHDLGEARKENGYQSRGVDFKIAQTAAKSGAQASTPVSDRSRRSSNDFASCSSSTALILLHEEWSKRHVAIHNSIQRDIGVDSPEKYSVSHVNGVYARDGSDTTTDDCVPLTRALLVSSSGCEDVACIEYLDLSFERITDLAGGTSALDELTMLKSLTLSSNSLSTLDGLWTHSSCASPTKGRAQARLERLVVNDNHLINIDALSRSAVALSLLHVSLSCNNLSRLGAGLSRATNLTSLILSSNRLESLHGIEACTSLLLLDASVNNLTTLGGSLRPLTLIQHVDVSFNRIAAIEYGELCACSHLRSFNVSENRLTTFPHFVGNVNLKSVAANVNRINTLDLGRVFLPFLETIEVSDNAIERVSGRSFLGLPSLTTLNVGFNKLGKMGLEAFAREMRDARLGIRYLKLNDNGIDVNKADYEARLAVALPLLKELDCDTVAGALTLIDSGVHYEQQQHTSETMVHAAKQIMLLREEGFGMRQRGIDSYTSPFTRVVMDNLEGECRLMTAQAISHRQFNRGRTPEGITASLASLARLTYFPHLPSWQAGHRFGANGYKDLWSANTLLTLIRKFRDGSTPTETVHLGSRVLDSTELQRRVDALLVSLRDDCGKGRNTFATTVHDSRHDSMNHAVLDDMDAHIQDDATALQSAARSIQRVWRGHRGRVHARIRREERRIEEEERRRDAEEERRKEALRLQSLRLAEDQRRRREEEERLQRLAQEEKDNKERAYRLDEEKRRKEAVIQAEQRKRLIYRSASKIAAAVRGFLLRRRLQKAKLRLASSLADNDMEDFPEIDESFYAPPPDISLDPLPVRKIDVSARPAADNDDRQVSAQRKYQYQYYDPNDSSDHTYMSHGRIRVEAAGPSTSSTVSTIHAASSPTHARHPLSSDRENAEAVVGAWKDDIGGVTLAVSRAARAERLREKQQNEVEAVMREWGFKEYAAAEAFLKSRRRQQQQQQRYKQQQKMRDPARRLERFRQNKERMTGQFGAGPTATFRGVANGGGGSSSSTSTALSSPASMTTLSAAASQRAPSVGATQHVRVRRRRDAGGGVPKPSSSGTSTTATASGSRNIHVLDSSDSNVRIIRDLRHMRKPATGRRLAWG